MMVNILSLIMSEWQGFLLRELGLATLDHLWMTAFPQDMKKKKGCCIEPSNAVMEEC